MRTVLFLLLAATFGGVAIGATPAFIPPHTEQLAPGVYAAGFAHRFDDANCGWVALKDHTLLVDLPRGLELRPFLDYVQQVSGKPVTKVVTTSMRAGDDKVIAALAKEGVEKVAVPAGKSRTQVGDDSVTVEVLPYGNVAGLAGNAVFLPQSGVMFSGPAVINGPRAKLPGTKTAAWLKELVKLESLKPTKVVPGSGSWGGDKVLERQRRFLTELRNQVGYGIAKGRSLENIAADVRLPFSCYVWMPYDLPAQDDIKHIYGELTAPHAPFGDDPPSKLDGRTHGLVLIGDRMHEPEHAERGLRQVFEAANVVPHFTVDYRALNAKNLAKVSLLVIQRDGMLWPDGDDKPYRAWMQPDQEADVVDFVNKGGGFLCLRNSMGLFPENGPYLRLVGGRVAVFASFSAIIGLFDLGEDART